MYFSTFLITQLSKHVIYITCIITMAAIPLPSRLLDILKAPAICH